MTYSVLDDIMLVFDDEDHVKSRKNGRHEVNVLLGGCVYVRREGSILREREHEREREKEEERKKLTASPLVSSHRPKTELAAASTEHLELRVVVIPA